MKKNSITRIANDAAREIVRAVESKTGKELDLSDCMAVVDDCMAVVEKLIGEIGLRNMIGQDEAGAIRQVRHCAKAGRAPAAARR